MPNSSELDTLKSNPAVLKVYSAYVRLQKDGAEYVGLCPFHSENTGSFRVSQHEGSWVYKCFGCGEAGNVLQLVCKLDKCRFPEAVKKVRNIVGTGWQQQKEADNFFKPVAAEDKPALVVPLESFTERYETALASSPEAKKWLESRGISFETAQRLHLGYRQDVGKLAGEKNKDIADKGWIVFPCVSGDKVLAIKYRSVVAKAFCKQGGMAKGERTPLFNADTISPFDPVYLVEGEPDAAVLEQAGFKTASIQSATTGCTASNKDQLLEADQVILAGDNDPEGQEAMNKLWAEMQERTFKLTWPAGCKDANQTFLEKCGGDVDKFRRLVQELTSAAQSCPMPGMYSLPESMISSERVNMAEHPGRLRMPWNNVDNMVNIVPGTVLSLFATNTGMGKTTTLMNVLVYNSLQFGKRVLNYSAELSVDEYSNLVAAHVLKKDRNFLTKEDYKEAAKIIRNMQFYIGRNPDLNTANQVLDLIEAGIRRFSPHIVALDHLHYICRNEQDTVKAQENAMQRIKGMAVKYGVIFVVVGQPRKADQQRRGKVVHISDAKGSETFSSDADAVVALHRDLALVTDPDNPPKEPYSPLTQVHLMKGRSQGTGNAYAELMFHGSTATFYEVTKGQEAPEPARTREMFA